MASEANGTGEHQSGEFEIRRAELVAQIGDSLENVLTQINALNRNLEDIIRIGNEFGSVEALWSQFEAVAAEVPGDANDGQSREQGGERDSHAEVKQ